MSFAFTRGVPKALNTILKGYMDQQSEYYWWKKRVIFLPMPQRVGPHGQAPLRDRKAGMLFSRYLGPTGVWFTKWVEIMDQRLTIIIWMSCEKKRTLASLKRGRGCSHVSYTNHTREELESWLSKAVRGCGGHGQCIQTKFWCVVCEHQVEEAPCWL